MNAQEMWSLYSAKENITADYEAWAFGDNPDELAQLVLKGIKTSTASAYAWYPLEGLELPKVGEYSVILDSNENAVCITKTVNVYVVPFDEVSSDHAYKEGEGDRSLAYWRKVHADFFMAEMSEAGLHFDEKMNVVCEEFEKIYPLDTEISAG